MSDNPYSSPQTTSDSVGVAGIDTNLLPITVRYIWTADELVKATQLHKRAGFRRGFRLALQVFFAAIALLGVALVLSVDYAGYALLVGGTLALILSVTSNSWILRWRFNRRPDNQAEITWTIDADQLKNQHDMGRTEFTWKAIAKVVKTPEGLLMYPNDQLFYWLPRHGFAGSQEFETLAELAKTKVERFFAIR